MTVIDASALVTLARREPGSSVVAKSLSTGHVSMVNVSEFVQKLGQYGSDGRKALEKLEQVGLTLYDVLREDAYAAAEMWPVTRPFGLSLADRLCLALAQRLGMPVLTADRAWLAAGDALNVRIDLIRP